MLQTILLIIQFILGLLLIIAIMLQQKGGGLGAAFGGSGTIHTTRRGADLALHKATIGISILFFVTAFLQVVLF